MKLASDMWKGSASYEQQKYRDIYEDKFSSYKQSVKVKLTQNGLQEKEFFNFINFQKVIILTLTNYAKKLSN